MDKDTRNEFVLALAALAAFVALQFWFIFRLNINWDEYYFLSHIYAAMDGRLTEPFQTFHVELFSWLTELPLSEPDQIIAGRLVMFACEMVTLGFIAGIARCFLSRRETIFALVAYCTASYVMAYGASFRTDPIALTCMMGSLYTLFCAPAKIRYGLIAGAAAALGLLITIKSILFLPAFAAALLFRMGDQLRRQFIPFFAASLAAVALFYTIGWLLHAQSLALEVTFPPSSANASSALPQTNGTGIVGSATSSFMDTIANIGFFPQSIYLTIWMGRGPMTALVIFAGIISAAIHIFSAKGLHRFIPILLVAPALSMCFYRNAFPYFYPFILATPVLGVGLLSARIKSPLIRLTILAMMAAGLILQFNYHVTRDQVAQRSVAMAVHQMFPDPVLYIDRNGMIPSFQKVGFFMSGWGREKALANGNSPIANVIHNARPPLVIANHPSLENAFHPISDAPRIMLGRDDSAALRNNYIQVWGPVYLAGKRLTLSDTPTSFHVVIPGRYRLQCSAPLMLDGISRNCGNTFHLTKGPHIVTSMAPATVTLIWDHVPIQNGTPPAPSRIFHAF